MSREEGSGNCWSCGLLLVSNEFGRGDSCRQCGRDTKTCKGCLFFDKNYNNECREPQADRVVEKERSNFCDYFKPKFKNEEALAPSPQDALKAAAEALFKKK